MSRYDLLRHVVDAKLDAIRYEAAGASWLARIRNNDAAALKAILRRMETP